MGTSMNVEMRLPSG